MGEGKEFEITILHLGSLQICVLKKEDIFKEKRAYISPPLSMLSLARVRVPLLAGIAGLNTVEGMDVACDYSVLSEISVMGGSCVHWSHIECGVSEHDHAALRKSRLWPPRSCVMDEKWLPYVLE